MLTGQARQLSSTPDIPVQGWREFRRWFAANWQQGEHVTLIGTTGCGKTTLATQILGLRNYVVAFGVKGRDETMEDLIRAGYWRMRRWNGDVDNYVVLWPDIRGVDHTQEQREVFKKAMDSIYRAGGWCVFLDEVSYLSDILKMDRELKWFLQQGRSSGISVIGSTQRPAFIPLAFYDQASHLFLWKDNDHRNLKRLGELAGLRAREVAATVAGLSKHQVLYYNKDTEHCVLTTVEV